MQPTRLRLAILTHNALEFSRRCLDSISAHTPVEHEILVLDNGSEDETPEWLKTHPGPGVRVILSPLNLGVPKGRNVLLGVILREVNENDILIFLDNDVEVSKDWYRPFLDVFANESSVGIAGVTGHEIIVHDDHRELLSSPATGPTAVDVVSGYCLWVRTRVARILGPFDENLGLFWHEDDDYCVRAIGLGYGVYAVPDVGVVHQAHQSGAARQSDAQEASLRNQRYLVEKWTRLGLIDGAGQIVRRHAF